MPKINYSAGLIFNFLETEIDAASNNLYYSIIFVTGRGYQKNIGGCKGMNQMVT